MQDQEFSDKDTTSGLTGGISFICLNFAINRVKAIHSWEILTE